VEYNYIYFILSVIWGLMARIWITSVLPHKISTHYMCNLPLVNSYASTHWYNDSNSKSQNALH